MDSKVMDELSPNNTVPAINAIEYAERCQLIYERTLQAMGFFPAEHETRSVLNSQLTYSEEKSIGGPYGDLPETY